MRRNRSNTGLENSGRLRYFLSWFLWPALFLICMSVTAYGFVQDDPYLPFICFNGAYAFLIISLFYLERFMPHETSWHKSDGQTLANIAHTLTSKGTSQILLVVNSYIGANILSEGQAGLFGIELWPSQFPIVGQVVLALIVSEFMLYWAHRSAHEFMPLWRFHAIHHSVEKLWFVNTGRFHFVDSLYSIVLGIIPLIALGASMDIIMWLGVVTAFIGMLTHCNVEMRFGVLSWIFNTPELHRWHHSKALREGNTNYGENLMIWDHVFRTFFHEDRRPPVRIGIHEYMPKKFTHQLLWPFLTQKKKDVIIASCDADSLDAHGAASYSQAAE
ncbi:MAG: sterol desaturase family protein [Alphaproteobacteria bacterium]